MSNKYKSFILKILVVIAAIVSWLLLVEAAIRLRQYMRYGTATANAAIVNSQGYRSLQLENPKPAGAVRLAFLGASNVFCRDMAEEKTWPYLIWHKLQRTYPQIKMDYANAGVLGFRARHELVNLEKYIKPLKPDVIVICEGFNNICLNANVLAKNQGRRINQESWLTRHSLVYNLIRKNLVIFSNQRKARLGKDGLVFTPKELLRNFQKELIELIVASKKEAPIVAIATTSYKIRREQPDSEKLKNANTAFYYLPYMNVSGILDAYEEQNRIVREVAEETGVILIDVELAIPGNEKYFRDSVHFTEQGCELMAERVADSLTGSPEFNKFLHSRAEFKQSRN